MCRNVLYHARVDRESGKVDWRRVDSAFPKPPSKIKYHYEFQPVVHDTRRDRLVQLKGDGSRVDVYVRSLADDEKARVRFIHLNHTNPALVPTSAARQAVEAAGFHVAEEGERHEL